MFIQQKPLATDFAQAEEPLFAIAKEKKILQKIFLSTL